MGANVFLAELFQIIILLMRHEDMFFRQILVAIAQFLDDKDYSNVNDL